MRMLHGKVRWSTDKRLDPMPCRQHVFYNFSPQPSGSSKNDKIHFSSVFLPALIIYTFANEKLFYLTKKHTHQPPPSRFARHLPLASLGYAFAVPQMQHEFSYCIWGR